MAEVQNRYVSGYVDKQIEAHITSERPFLLPGPGFPSRRKKIGNSIFFFYSGISIRAQSVHRSLCDQGIDEFRHPIEVLLCLIRYRR